MISDRSQHKEPSSPWFGKSSMEMYKGNLSKRIKVVKNKEENEKKAKEIVERWLISEGRLPKKK